jgi:hypothetical protein
VLVTIRLTAGALVINRALTIQGPGARRLAVSGNNISRVFTISGTDAVTISRLTITRGKAPVGPVLPATGGNAYGGAIYNAVPLTLVDCAITNSLAQGSSSVRGQPSGGGYGGGIYNAGSLTMRNCLLAGNSARSGNTGTNNAPSYGGGLYSFAPFTLTNTTIANNHAQNSGGPS